MSAVAAQAGQPPLVDPDRGWDEEPRVFACGAHRLVGVLSRPAPDNAQAVRGGPGVVIVVGGPQYRAGSHRHFVLLARRLAAAGHPTLRFDVRGMGDSEGEPPGFENLDDDIAAAIDELCASAGVSQVVLWGLCDGASAALMYTARRADPRVRGLCLLNPWVRSADTQAAVQVKHYYASRLGDPAFWRKLLRGGVAWTAPLELARSAWVALRARLRRRSGADGRAPADDFKACMAQAWQRFGGPVLLQLSENDLTALEFVEALDAGAPWQQPWARPGLQRVDLAGADHTLSLDADRAAADRALLSWLAGLPSRS